MLPERSIAWPPKPHDQALTSMRTWDAWYVGDPDRLHEAYNRTTVARVRPAQYAGGVVGAVARWFWGRPTPPGEHRTRLHVPLPADIATTSADMLFGEQPAISLPDGSDEQRERLDEILDDGAYGTLIEAAEIAAALGGAYLRVQWDADVAEHAFLDAVHADAAVPEFRWGRLNAVTFWHQVEADDDKVVLRWLERHEPGAILHGLYSGTATELGRPVPLAEHPATADLPVNADSAILTDTQRLTAAYVPNMRPNRAWRSRLELAPLGRSDFDGVEGLFDALDETYSSWMRDVRLGKARILVPEAYLENQGPGRGAVFDEDREVFAALNMLPKPGDPAAITPQQFAIRWAEHAETARSLTDQAVRAAGYSASTFGEHRGDTDVTATEIAARERRSMTTREKKTRYWDAALQAIVPALLDVDAYVFGSNTRDLRVDVEFGATVQPNPLHIAQTADYLNRANAASARTLVQMVHPDWDEIAVEEEAGRIVAEKGLMLADPFTTVPDDAQA
jgi:A118 family predicted phage portal protein